MEYARQLNWQNVAYACRSNPAIHSTFLCVFVSILAGRGQLCAEETEKKPEGGIEADSV